MPRAVRHPQHSHWKILCFRATTSGGARIDGFHVQFKEDTGMYSGPGAASARECTMGVLAAVLLLLLLLLLVVVVVVAVRTRTITETVHAMR